MALIQKLTCIIFTLLLSCLSYSQDSNIVISESAQSIVCGKIVIVDALWVYDGVLKADISVLEQQNSKPITGGYKKGDEITVSSEPGCTYYIFSIEKNGSISNKGFVTLSKKAPASITEIIDGNFTANENYTFRSGDYNWYFSSINEIGGNLTANIKITKNTALIEDLALKVGDQVFIGEFLYKVESIKPGYKDNVKDPQGYYEYNPGTIRFTSFKQFIPDK